MLNLARYFCQKKLFNSFPNEIKRISQLSFYFTDNEFNNRKFIEKQNEILQNKALVDQTDSIRSRLANSLTEVHVDHNQLLEDLKSFIYLAKSDSDFEAIYKVFHKYSNHNLNKFYLSTMFIRRLLLENRINLANRAFNDKNLEANLMKEMSAMTCLLDKLIDEKMYDQVLELYDVKFIKMRKIPNSFLTAVTYSLFKKNSTASYTKVKTIVDLINKKNLFLSVDSVVHVFLLALNQNDIIYALNFLSKSTKIHRSLFNNLIAIGLVCANDLESAYYYAENITQTHKVNHNPTALEGKVFPLTLKYLNEAAVKSNNQEMREKIENLNRYFADNNRILKTDLVEFYAKSSIKFSNSKN